MSLVRPIRARVLPRIPPIDGRPVELQKTNTHVQWRYAAVPGSDATAWTNLIALTDITGPQGPNVEFRNNGTHIQWSVEDEDDWQDLVPLTEITGPEGPVGPVGMNWLGAYSGATAYVLNDVVSDQGGSWIALQNTTGNAPPTLPTTSDSNWSLVAAPGEDGANGTMTGPGSSTDNAIVRFDGTGGSTLQNSGVVIDDSNNVTGAANLVTLTGSQTLTNKTLTSFTANGTSTLNGTLAGSAFLDQDDMSSNSDVRVPSQQSVKAYVDAQVATRARIATGSYTGDGATSLAITGVGFLPKIVWIHLRVTADSTGSAPIWTSNVIVDDNASGMAMTDGGAQWTGRTDRIIALGSDGFTVDDSGSDGAPNTNGAVYNYWAIG